MQHKGFGERADGAGVEVNGRAGVGVADGDAAEVAEAVIAVLAVAADGEAAVQQVRGRAGGGIQRLQAGGQRPGVLLRRAEVQRVDVAAVGGQDAVAAGLLDGGGGVVVDVIGDGHGRGAQAGRAEAIDAGAVGNQADIEVAGKDAGAGGVDLSGQVTRVAAAGRDGGRTAGGGDRTAGTGDRGDQVFRIRVGRRGVGDRDGLGGAVAHMQVQRARRGQRRCCLTVDRALHGHRGAAKVGHRAGAGIRLVIQVDLAGLHAGIAGVQARRQACVVGRTRRQQGDTAILRDRAARAAAEDVEEAAARRGVVADADRLLLVRSQMDIAEVDRAGGVEHRRGGGLDGAGDDQRLGVHRLREAVGIAVRPVEGDGFGVDTGISRGEADVEAGIAARADGAEIADAAVAEGRIAAGGERTAQPVRGSGCRIEQAEIGYQPVAGDRCAEVEREDAARPGQAAGAGQLAECRRGVVVDGDGDRHIDNAQARGAEAVDPGAVADRLHRDLAADGAGRRGGDGNGQGRGVAAAGGDVGGAAGGAEAAGSADDGCVQTFRPDAGRRGVGGGQRLGEGSAAISGVQIHIGRRGDGRSGLVEDVAGDRDGLRWQDDAPTGTAAIGVIDADAVHAVPTRVVAPGQGQHGAVGRRGRQCRILDPAVRGCIADRNDVGAAEPDVQIAGVIAAAVIPDADVVGVAGHGVQRLRCRSVAADTAQGQIVCAVKRGDILGAG